MQPTAIQTQVRSALSPSPTCPLAIRALLMLGVRDSTISNTLGVSPTHFHFWKMGSRPVPPKRQQELLKLLKDAHAIAAQAVEEYAATYKLKKDDIALVFQRTRVAAAAGVIARLESEDE